MPDSLFKIVYIAGLVVEIVIRALQPVAQTYMQRTGRVLPRWRRD